MAAEFEINDTQWLASLSMALGRVRLGAERGLEATATEVTNETQRNCPVRTGRLRASFHHNMGVDARGVYADVVSNVNYAVPVEFGHMAGKTHVAPRAMLRRAMLSKGTARDLARNVRRFL